MSKTIIVSELFYPDQTSTAYVMTKIADKLSEQANVEVICGDGIYDEGMSVSNIQEKPYPIHRIKKGKHNKNNLVSRIFGFFISSFRLSRKLYSITSKEDKVLIVTNPALFLIFCSLIKKYKKFDLTIVVQDVFPENAVAAGIISSKKNLLYRILKSIFNKAYCSSDRLIVIGRDMENLFSEKLSPRVPPMVLIENWADPSPDSTFTSKDNDPIKLQFAGNIGRCQGLERFTELFGKVNNPNIEFELRGGGAVVPILKDIIKNDGISNINIGGPFKREDQFKILDNCDISLVTLCEGMYGLGVPSKSYNIMSAGKPILYVGDPMSEIALVIKEEKIGYVFANSDEEGLLQWLNNVNKESLNEFHQMGLRARNLALTRFSEKTILSKYSNLFNSL